MADNATGNAEVEAQVAVEDEPLPRETGNEKSGETCPNCGTELPTTETSYGSVITGACPKCSKDQIAAQKAAVDAAEKANKAAAKEAEKAAKDEA